MLSKELLEAIEKVCVHYRDNRGRTAPYYLYTPYDLKRSWIKTTAGRVMVKIDTTLPIGTIYVLSERVGIS